MHAVRKLSTRNWEHQRQDDRYTVQLARGGKPLAGIQSDRISVVEEEVMRWENANHIHGWFVDNVQGKHDGGSHRVPLEKLRLLLEVCEKVLDSAQLVRAKVFSASEYGAIRQRMESQGVPTMEIKNVSIAHKLLPTRSWDYTGANQYDGAYLKAVETTRDWAEKMLIDYENGLPGDIYYSSN